MECWHPLVSLEVDTHTYTHLYSGHIHDMQRSNSSNHRLLQLSVEIIRMALHLPSLPLIQSPYMGTDVWCAVPPPPTPRPFRQVITVLSCVIITQWSCDRALPCCFLPVQKLISPPGLLLTSNTLPPANWACSHEGMIWFTLSSHSAFVLINWDQESIFIVSS